MNTILILCGKCIYAILGIYTASECQQRAMFLYFQFIMICSTYTRVCIVVIQWAQKTIKSEVIKYTTFDVTIDKIWYKFKPSKRLKEAMQLYTSGNMSRTLIWEIKSIIDECFPVLRITVGYSYRSYNSSLHIPIHFLFEISNLFF